MTAQDPPLARVPTLSVSAGSHRDRLIAGMAASIKEKGFRRTTVADVVRLARTSRRTFYEHFEDREACYLALFDVLSEMSMRAVDAAVDSARPWDEQVDRAIGAYLTITSAEPEVVRSAIHEMSSLGDRGLRRDKEVMDRFAALLVDLVDRGRRIDDSVRPLPFDAALLVIAGLRELMTRALDDERDLMSLAPVAGDTIKAVLRR